MELRSNSGNCTPNVFLNNARNVFIFLYISWQFDPPNSLLIVAVTMYGSSSLQAGFFPRSSFGFNSTWPIAERNQKNLKNAYCFSSLFSYLSDDWVLLVVVSRFCISILEHNPSPFSVFLNAGIRRFARRELYWNFEIHWNESRSEWGGPHVGCRLKFHHFVGCRLKFSNFVGCR